MLHTVTRQGTKTNYTLQEGNLAILATHCKKAGYQHKLARQKTSCTLQDGKLPTYFNKVGYQIRLYTVIRHGTNLKLARLLTLYTKYCLFRYPVFLLCSLSCQPAWIQHVASKSCLGSVHSCSVYLVLVHNLVTVCRLHFHLTLPCSYIHVAYALIRAFICSRNDGSSRVF